VRRGSFLIAAAFAAFVLSQLVSPSPAQGVPITEPIVFDFEDGLQGWGGEATRVQTQLLGGEWAVFGDGFARECFGTNGDPSCGFGASIHLETDLTSIGSISVEQFLIDGDEDALLLFWLTGFPLPGPDPPLGPALI
jgi:hypothetical protein